MKRVTVTLTPPGPGRWSRVVVIFDADRRSELPLPVSIKRGDVWPLAGAEYRVRSVKVKG